MLKLRILLLRDYIYYLILIISLIYFLFIYFSPTKSTIYKDITNLDCIITDIVIKDYGVQLSLKNKETIIGYYYLDSKDINYFRDNYSLGDKVKIIFEDMRITNNTVPNTFNYKKYLYNKGIYKVVEVKAMEKILDNKNIFYKVKNMFLKRSFKLEKSYPYVYSLLFAENSYLDEDMVISYRENGISHLFAISGSHISIFILALSFLLKKLKIKENKRFFIMIVFLLFYMFITNFSMSVVRASVFTILLFINKIFYFHIKSINLLFLTLAIILFFNPLNLLDIGLQYSFVISLSLIFMQDFLNKQKGYLRKLLTISFISFIVSLPITIYNFYSLNFLSILNNLIFVPFVTFIILPLIFFSYIFPFLDVVLSFFINIMNNISLFLSQINTFKLIFCKISMSIFVVYYLSIFIYLFMLKKGKKKYIFLLIILLFLNHIWVLEDYNRLMFFDVGQGDSVFLQAFNTYSLIDTGGVVMYNDSKYTYNLSKNKIIPYLKSMGIKYLDNIFLTHGDLDHLKESIYIINNFKVKNIYLNSNDFNNLEEEIIKLAKSKKIKLHLLEENAYINLGGIKVHSLNGKRNNENDSSLVLYFNINNYKVLLTGDISKSVEKELIKKYDLANLTILKLAHHGSKTSSDYEFLKTTNPKYCIISAGYDNKFNHPSKEVIKSLNELNFVYYETTVNGSITFNFEKGTFSFCNP